MRGINTNYQVGQPVLIRDHISLTATSPLIGADFVDLTDLYSKRIRAIVKNEDNSLAEGVYVHWRGPAYETPAEIRMMRTIGADLVGMSTVPEAIAAHSLGAEVLGISGYKCSSRGHWRKTQPRRSYRCRKSSSRPHGCTSRKCNSKLL